MTTSPAASPGRRAMTFCTGAQYACALQANSRWTAGGAGAGGADARRETVADAVVLGAADRVRRVADDVAMELQGALGGELAGRRRGRLRRGAAKARQRHDQDRAEREKDEARCAARHARAILPA